MLRFGAALASLAFLLIAIKAQSAGVLGFALLMVVVCATIAIFAFAAARIDNSGREQVYVPSPDEIALLRARAERQRAEAEAKRGGESRDA